MKATFILSRKGSSSEKEIFVRIHNRKLDLRTSTNMSVSQKYWSTRKKIDKQGKKTTPKENFGEIVIKDEIPTPEHNAAANTKVKLLELGIRIEQQYVKDEAAGVLINKKWLEEVIDKFQHPEKYNPKEKPEPAIISFAEDFISNIDEYRIKNGQNKGSKLTQNTIKDYKTCLNKLREFSKCENNGKDFKFEELDNVFYSKYVNWLESIEHKKNSIGKYIKSLKSIVHKADPTLIAKTKIDEFSTLTEEINNIYLTEEELQSLYKLDLSNNKTLEHAKDNFLLLAWTGCRYSDLDKITTDRIANGFLNINQKKTDKAVSIPVVKVVKEILQKYDGNPAPIISNQKFNEYIKEVANFAGITEQVCKHATIGGVKKDKIFHKYELITTHTARRSFVTNMYKRGVPAITLKNITGHKTESAFLSYIKLDKQQHAEIMSEYLKDVM